LLGLSGKGAENRFSRTLEHSIVEATARAVGPRQQVEVGMAAYFEMMVGNEHAFRLLYGRDAPDDPELGAALRRVEDTIARAIDPLIDADLDPEHRLLLACSVVGMAEGASRHWIDSRSRSAMEPDGGQTGVAVDPEHAAEQASLLATRVADLAWAGLRQVHPV
jgi:hypothetical protein